MKLASDVISEELFLNGLCFVIDNTFPAYMDWNEEVLHSFARQASGKHVDAMNTP